MFGPLVRVQVGGSSILTPFRRKLRWPAGVEEPPLVVGDRVLLEGKPPDLVVAEVEARTTTLARRSPGERRARVVAANVDQAVVVMAAAAPAPNPRLLDRLLVACHHAGIAPIVCFNKIDQGSAAIDVFIGDYQDAGYEIMLASARTSRGVGCLTRRLGGHTTLFCGPSGAGKSALLNAIHPGYRLREGSISEATGKGRHTTTTAQLLPLPSSGFVVDTPGIREFGFWDLTPDALQACFPEVDRLVKGCAFPACHHLAERGCAVRGAVEGGQLSSRRYASFLKLREELAEGS